MTPGSTEVLNPCWCCGRECMFCEPETANPPCYGLPVAPWGVHWCANCKFGAGPGHECWSEE